MMTMRRCLFIGGPIDGEWREVDTDRMSYRIVPPTPLQSFSRARVSELMLVTVKYVRYPVAASDRSCEYLYVYEGLNGRGVMRRLLAGYRPA